MENILPKSLYKVKGSVMMLHLENAPCCRTPVVPAWFFMALQQTVRCGVSPPPRQGSTCQMQKQLLPFNSTARGHGGCLHWQVVVPCQWCQCRTGHPKGT